MTEKQGTEKTAGDPQDAGGQAQIPRGSGFALAPPARAFPGFWQAVLLLVISSLLQVLLIIPFAIAGLMLNPAAMAVPVLVATAVVAATGFKLTRARFGEVFPFAPVGWTVLFALLLAVAGLFVLRLDIAKILTWISPPPSWFSRFLKEMVGSPGLWGSLAAGGLAIPFAEEILYRGLILHGFVRRYGAAKAIVVSAFLFALMHGNPWQSVTAFILAVLLAWCVIRTRSLIPCIFAHMVNNSIGFMLIALKVQLPGETADAAAGIVFHPWWLNGAALLTTALGLFLLFQKFNFGVRHPK